MALQTAIWNMGDPSDTLTHCNHDTTTPPPQEKSDTEIDKKVINSNISHTLEEAHPKR